MNLPTCCLRDFFLVLYFFFFKELKETDTRQKTKDFSIRNRKDCGILFNNELQINIIFLFLVFMEGTFDGGFLFCARVSLMVMLGIELRLLACKTHTKSSKSSL